MKLSVKILMLFLFTAGNLAAQDSLYIRSYGLKGYNYGEKIIQTADTGFIILGNKSGFVGNTDIYLVKTNMYGNLVWDKAYGGDEVNWAEDFVKTKDNGYVIAGYITIPANNDDYNILLMKTDSVGHLKWTKNFGGSNWDLAHSLIETPDSGFLITGETYSFGNGNNDVFVLKTDKNGDSLWMKTYGGPNTDIGNDINIYHDGNYILTGSTTSFGKGGYDIYLLKINSAGDTLWTSTFGDTLDDKADAGIEMNDHGIIVVGSTKNFNVQNQDGILLKLDSVGKYKWKQFIDGALNEDLYDIVQHKNTNLFFVGYTQSYGYIGTQDFSMSLRNTNGDFITGNTFGGDKNDYAKSCITTFDGGFAVVGTTASMGLGITNILFLKTDSMIISDPSTYIHITDIPEEYTSSDIILFPNPVSDILNIRIPQKTKLEKIMIWNNIGQCVYESLLSNNHNATINFSIFPTGMYIISLHTSESVITRRIIHTR